MRQLAAASVILWAAVAHADAPTGYQCGESGKPSPGKGCECGAGLVSARNASNTAICKPTPIIVHDDARWTRPVIHDGMHSFLVVDANDDAIVLAQGRDYGEHPVRGTTLVRIAATGKERSRVAITRKGGPHGAPVLVAGSLWTQWHGEDSFQVIAFDEHGNEAAHVADAWGNYDYSLDHDAGGLVVFKFHDAELHLGRPSGSALTWTAIPVALGKIALVRLLPDGNVAIAATPMAGSTLSLSIVSVGGAVLASTETSVRATPFVTMYVGPRGEIALYPSPTDSADVVIRVYDSSAKLQFARLSGDAKTMALDRDGQVITADMGQVVQLRHDGSPNLSGGLRAKASADQVGVTSHGDFYVVTSTETSIDLSLVRGRPVPVPKVTVAAQKGEVWRVETNHDSRLAVDPAGDTFLTFKQQTPRGNSMFIVRKLDREGRLIWEHSLDEFREIRQITANPAGEVFATGWVGAARLGITKLAADGRTLWARSFDSGGQEATSFWEADEGYAIHLAANGSVVVVGRRVSAKEEHVEGWVIKLSADGSTQWDTSIGAKTDSLEATRIVSDGADGVIVGSVPGGASMSVGEVITRLDGAGKTVWTWAPSKVNWGDGGLVLASRPRGGVYVATTVESNAGQRIRIVELDGDGKQLASHDYAPTEPKHYVEHQFIAALYVDPAGSLIAAGSGPSKTGEGWIMKLDAAGAQSAIRFTIGAIHAVGTDSDGNLYALTGLAAIKLPPLP